MKHLLLPALLFVPAFPQDTTRELSGTALIDAYLEQAWKKNDLTPGRRADDFEWRRRVTLDIVGRLPRPDEVGKAYDRAKLVEELLASPEYAEYWAEVWVRTLLGYDFIQIFFRQDLDYRKLREYLREAFEKNRPYNEWVRELIAAEGDVTKTPEAHFLLRYFSNFQPKQPTEAAGQVTRVFLGIQMQCAQCHNHPFDVYTQEQFWQMTAFFARTRQRTTNTFDGKKSELVDIGKSEQRIPGTDKTVTPKFLDGQEPGPNEKRRQALAKYVTESRQFARAMVNRVWSHFFGRGFVEPIDKFTSSVKPSHPELLDKLAEDFARHKYDLKWLIRSIANSRAYHLTSKAGRDETKKDKLFTHALVRPMNAVQLFNALIYALGAEEYIKQELSKNKEAEKFQYVLYGFVQALLGITNQSTEAQRYAGTAQQALVFMNNKDFNNALNTNPLVLGGIMQKYKKPEDRLNAIVVRLLSRPASPSELDRFVKYVKDRKESRDAYEDVYWVLMNTNEFFFNH